VKNSGNLTWRGLGVAFALLIFLGSAGSSSAFASDGSPYGPLKPFQSDGCTHFPNGSLAEPELWLHCCTHHDLSYWAGGTAAERGAADRRLKECVEETGHPEAASLMFVGVRMGGRSHWGTGWTVPRGYAPLTDEERREVWDKTPAPLKSLDGDI